MLVPQSPPVKVEQPEAAYVKDSKTDLEVPHTGSNGANAPPIRLNVLQSTVRVIPTFTSTYGQRIFRLLFVSIVVSWIAFGFTMVTKGESSYWATPVATGLTTIFNLVLLFSLWREGRRNRLYDVELCHTELNVGERHAEVVLTDFQGPRISIAPDPADSIVATLSTVVCAWTLAFLWILCGSLVIVSTIVTAATGRYRVKNHSRRVVEIIVTFGQAAVAETIAKYCTRERRWVRNL